MKICKKTGLVMLSIVSALCLYAQNAEEVEEISLPDVSTVISGGAPKVGKSAVSDFTDVLPSADEKIENVIPQLPEASDAGSLNSDSVVTVAPEKTIYVEGLAGGGYPGYITGNFKIYRQTGYSPFRVEFGHESANGYSGRSLTSAFYDRETFIAAEKTFQLKKSKLELSAAFESDDDGLQNCVEDISSVTKENLGGGVKWETELGKGFGFGAGAEAGWYKRYATVTDSALAVEEYAENVSFLELNPELYFTWKKENFSSKLSANYGLQYDIKNCLYGDASLNRGDFELSAGWKNDVISAFASAGVIVGNRIGDNSVVVPFEAGVDFSFASKISSRRITMGMKGGMESEVLKISDAERLYKFSAFSVLPEETSSWFGKIDLALPIKDRFTLTFDGEFKTTAYKNGVIMPDYDSSAAINTIFGQYLYEQKDTTQFNTGLDFAVRIGLLNLSAEWKAFWIDVPALEAKQFAGVRASIQSKSSKFGLEAGAGLSMDPDDDNTPDLDVSAFCRLTPAVRLAVSADDVVKLITGEERDYAGEYISRSGTASVLVKFFF